MEQEQDKPDLPEAEAPEQAADQFNRSQLARETFRKHPEWTLAQVEALIRTKTGKRSSLSTIHRARKQGLADPIRETKEGMKQRQIIAKEEEKKDIAGIMKRCITEKDWQTMTRKLVEMASKGDLKAYEVLTNRILGKPKEHHVEEKRTTSLNLSVFTDQELNLFEALMTKAQGAEVPALDYKAEDTPFNVLED